MNTLTIDDVRAYYSREEEKRRQRTYYTQLYPRHRIMLQAVSKLRHALKGDLTVLDVGCGGGCSLHLLSDLIPPHRLCGVELSPVLAEIAFRRNPGVPVQALDFSAPVPVLDRQFRIIVAMDVYEHILPERVGAFWDNIGGSLLETGFVYLAFPSGAPPESQQIVDRHVTLSEVLWTLVLQRGVCPPIETTTERQETRIGDGITLKTGLPPDHG